MKRYLPHLGIALGIAIAIYALFFSDSDEDKIRALFERLEQAVAVHADDNIVIRGARVKKELSEIVVKEVTFDIPELSQSNAGRDVLTGLAVQAPQLWKTADVDLDALELTIDDAGMGALAVGDAHLNATRHDGQLHQDTRKVSISLEKIDGEWRIVGLTVSSRGGGN